MTSNEATRATRFRGLMAPHLDSAYSLARYLCRDASAAEDIAQDALLQAYAAFDGFRGDSPKAWLLAIVRNAHVDWVRRSRGWRAMTSDRSLDEVAEIADGATPSVETTLIDRDDREALRVAIEALPEPFREAVVLRDIEGLSYHEIARITRAPTGTVMSRLARGRQGLMERLRPLEGVDR